MSSTLYRKYRPLKFSEIIGQKHIVKTLSNSIGNSHIGHAFIFTGPRGTGKTTLARIFAKTINCASVKKEKDFFEPCLKCDNCKSFQDNKFADVFEIDAASNTGVDNIRDLKETAQLPPLQGKYKVYIIDEVHMLSQGAFNALLKILEEPPSHIVFVLATTELHKIPETVVSRCQKFDFAKFDTEEIVKKLSKIVKTEKANISDEIIDTIALMAEGGMRDAESLLEQAISLGKKSDDKEIKELFGITEHRFVEQLTNLVLNKKTGEAILFINRIHKDGYNLEFFVKSWLDYLRKIMIAGIDTEIENKIFSGLTKKEKKEIKLFAEKISPAHLVSYIDEIAETISKIKTSFIPQLPLETTIVKLTADEETETTTDSDQTSEFSNTEEETDQRVGKQEHPSEKSDNKKSFKIEKAEMNNEKNRKDRTKNEELGVTEPALKAKSETNKITTKSEEKKEQEGKEKKKKPTVINIGKIEGKWKEIISEIGKENFSLSMMLTNSRPIKNDSSDKVHIVVLRDFHKEMINKMENRLTIKNISNKITELEFDVEAVTSEESGVRLKTILPKETLNEEGKNESLGKNQANQNSLLNDALNLIGGKVVEG